MFNAVSENEDGIGMILLHTGIRLVSREQTKTKLFPNFDSASLLQKLAYLEDSFRRLNMLTITIRRETASVAEKVHALINRFYLWVPRLEKSRSARLPTLAQFGTPCTHDGA